MKKLIVLFVIFLFLSLTFSQDTSFSKSIKKNKITITEDPETEYYAIIAGCTNYSNPNLTLFVDPFENENSVDILYDSLISGSNWKDDNIILLFNKNATKQNITNALIYMSEIVKENDVFLFSWRGHGGEVSDDNSDEKDGTDEIIVPYDFDNKTYITDDELNNYLSDIKSEKMIIMLESCLSGGFVGGDSDIDKPKRLCVLSTFENSLGRGGLIYAFPCQSFIAVLLNADNDLKFLDKNDDGFLSIQEVLFFAKLGVFSDKTLTFLIFYLAFKIRFRKNEFKKLLTFVIFYQLLYKTQTGHFIFNNLHSVDNVGYDIPLVKSKESK